LTAIIESTREAIVVAPYHVEEAVSQEAAQ
jgi:hypothetical protein